MSMIAPPACVRCGAELVPQARFCHRCGGPADFAAAGERRFATCVVADIADYTAICAACDPERVHAMLEAFFATGDRIVESAGGRVIDHAGDAIVAVFGAPVAFGDDAERAVRVAHALHAAASAIEDPRGGALALHVGCASGAVVAATIGLASQPKFTVTGDALNLAARLAAAAGPGETYLSDACRRAAARVGAVAQPRQLRLKGFVDAVTAWCVDAVSERAAAVSPFVGRQAELSVLDGVLQACRTLGQGGVVRVEGEAGIGKSRLLQQACERARTAGFATHVCGFVDFGPAEQRSAVAVLLAALVPAEWRHDAAGAARWLQATIASHPASADADRLPGEGGDAAGERDASSPVPGALLLEAELGAPLDASQRDRLASIPSERRRAAVVRALGALVRSLAEAQPRLVVVDDLHWAPESGAGLLERFAADAAHFPCVVAFASRESRAGADEPFAPLVIRLAPLAPEESALMAAELAPAGSYADACLRRAQGHPLFLESLLRAAQDGPAGELPGTVHSAVSSRVDRLDRPARDALLAASVFGIGFELRDLAALLAPDGELTALAPLAEALCAAGLLRADDGTLDFAHALVRDAVYALLLTSRRRELHRRAAAHFGADRPQLRAEHLLRAADPSAGEAFLEAAAHALRSLRPDAAAALAARGVESHPPVPVLADLLTLQGDALREAGRTRDAVPPLLAACALDVDAARIDRARLACVEVFRVTGEIPRALALLDEVERSARTREGFADLGRALNLRGSLLFAQGRAAACLDAQRAALVAARAAGDDEGVARALSGLGDAHYAGGEVAAAAARFGEALERARAAGLPRLALPAAALLGRCRAMQLQLDEAVALIDGAIDEAARAGLLHAELVTRSMLASVLLMRGEHARLEADAERGLQLAKAMGAGRFEVVLLRAVAAAQLARGAAGAALATLRPALELARKTCIDFMGPALLGVLAAATDDPRERAAALTEGEEILQRSDLAHSQIGYRLYAIECCLTGADWAGARMHADRLEARFRAIPIASIDLVVRRARLLADAGETTVSADGIHAALAAELAGLRARIEACGYRWLLEGAMARYARQAP